MAGFRTLASARLISSSYLFAVCSAVQHLYVIIALGLAILSALPHLVVRTVCLFPKPIPLRDHPAKYEGCLEKNSVRTTRLPPPQLSHCCVTHKPHDYTFWARYCTQPHKRFARNRYTLSSTGTSPHTVRSAASNVHRSNRPPRPR